MTKNRARHAEIAGGGIGGLTAGLALARQGWSVRIHERSAAIREIGAGITLKNNALLVLEAWDLFGQLRPHGTFQQGSSMHDRNGKLVGRQTVAGEARMFTVPRPVLVEVLARAAAAAGAEIVTSSQVELDQAGVLHTQSGAALLYDLAVIADGVNSRSRAILGRGVRTFEVPTRVDRCLLPTRSITPEDSMREYWSNGRRIGLLPCGGQTFVYMVCPRRDKQGAELPLNLASWQTAFPCLHDELALIAAGVMTQFPYKVVLCPRWSSGAAAFVGDAVHGMPSSLGQGANLTIMNAHALAHFVTNGRDVVAQVQAWEGALRPITDQTQRWSRRYDKFARHLPMAVQSPVIKAFSHFEALGDRMRVAERGFDVRTAGGSVTGS